jgi:UDP-N-acetylmuramate--alanine ligase
MSALAQYLLKQNIKVSGYDRDNTGLTKKLESLGMAINYEIVDIPEDVEVIIFTPALKPGQREYDTCKASGLPMLKRSEALDLIFNLKRVIAIAGTHGKTTTTAILAHIMYHAGHGVNSFVGGVMKNYNSNFLLADSDWVLVEADEFDRSFLRLYPEIAVIQAMDPDHLDIYGNEQCVIDAFKQFTLQIKSGGSLFVESTLLADKMDSEWKKSLYDSNIDLRTFGIATGDIWVDEVNSSEGLIEWSLMPDKVKLKICMIGEHNIRNAMGAILVAKKMGISNDKIAEALASFKGIERRMEYVYRSDKLIIIDDYAHHPEEIKATIAAVRRAHPDKCITVLFQPHLYTRTRDFLDDFAAALEKADELVLAEIYPARELPISGVSSEELLNRIKLGKKKVVRKENLKDYFKDKNVELLLLMGAGDANREIERIKESLIGVNEY